MNLHLRPDELIAALACSTLFIVVRMIAAKAGFKENASLALGMIAAIAITLMIAGSGHG